MKLLSFSILFGSLLISFNYVWINRISVTKGTYNIPSMVLLNKWTGNHCVLLFTDNAHKRKMSMDSDIKICKVENREKVILP